MNFEDIYARTERNRYMIADVLEDLEPVQWTQPTLCPGWTVRHMAAHFIQPMMVGFGRFLLVALRYRGDTPATVNHFTQRLARRDPAELIQLLRSHAPDRVNPFRVGPMGPFAETCIHLRDIARPLALSANVCGEDWRVLLDYLVSSRAAPSLVPAAGVDGIAFRATDSDWHHGTGPGEVAGPQESLAMAISGRPAALADLQGPGVPVLASRIAATSH